VAVHVESVDASLFDQRVLEPHGELVVVEFWGPDCPNCEVFERELPGLLESLGEVPARLVRVNAYEHTHLAQRFGLFGVPTFLLFRNGKRLGKMSQYQGREFWLAVVRENLPK
jgi:thioredoxin-like negative regulator of GroEL